jgi:hypothetical protein
MREEQLKIGYKFWLEHRRIFHHEKCKHGTFCSDVSSVKQDSSGSDIPPPEFFLSLKNKMQFKRASARISSSNTRKNAITANILFFQIPYEIKNSPVTGLEWLRGFQEVKVPRFHDNGTGWW